MPDVYRITIPGRPVPKGRPRFGKSGQVYTPKKTKEYEQFDDFYDVVQYKKGNGWKSQKRNGQWEDVCPECQESEVREGEI